MVNDTNYSKNLSTLNNAFHTCLINFLFIDLVKHPVRSFIYINRPLLVFITQFLLSTNNTNMSFIDYVMEVIFAITLYLFSVYIFMPMLFRPISVRVTQMWRQYLSLKMSSPTPLFKEDGTPYRSHTKNKFTSSFYTLTAMSPISSPLTFMSSPSMINRFLDECEIDRECDSPFGMASPFQVLINATAKRPKPVPRRTVLLGRQLQ